MLYRIEEEEEFGNAVVSLRHQIDDLSEHVSRLRNARNESSAGNMISPRHFIPATASPLIDVINYIECRKERLKLFPELSLHNPPWDIMVDLYRSNLAGKLETVSSVCIASGVPPTTALRHLERLTEINFIDRVRDTEDLRKSYIVLTPRALKRISVYFGHC